MRGSGQFDTYRGLRMGYRLFTNLLISCIAADAPVPSALYHLRDQLAQHVDTKDPKWLLSGLCLVYAKLRSDTLQIAMSQYEVMRRLSELDCEFAVLDAYFASIWALSTIQIPMPSERLFEPHYDIYPDHYTTQQWNVLRGMRMLLNYQLRRLSLDPHMEAAPTSRGPEEATVIIDNVARKICASVPQFTLAIREKKCNISELDRRKSYPLLWPLWLAATFASPTSKIKSWALKEIKYISYAMGFSKGLIVAEIVEEGKEVSPWSVYATLGSYAFAA